MLNFLLIILKGLVLGLSIVLPGISGGTMAFVMGIYEKLIWEISKFKTRHLKNLFLCLSFKKKQIKKGVLFFRKTWDWAFLIPLIFGLVCSVLIFIVFASPIIEQYSLQFYSIICGLILASVYKPLKEMKKNAKTLVLLFLSFLINFFLFVWGENLSLFSGDLRPLIFVPIGFLVAMALVVPGISGSYLLLVLGLYEKTLLALRQGDILVIGFFSMGSILGILLTARLIKYFIKNYFDEIIALISGLILSSLYVVYPLPKESLEEILSFNLHKKIFLFCFVSSFLIFIVFNFFHGVKKKPVS